MSSALSEPRPIVVPEGPPQRPSPRWRDPRLLALGALLLACAIGLMLSLWAGVIGIRAVPGVLRTAAAGSALFGICGYAPAHLLVRGVLIPHRPLLVLPIGGVMSSLLLAFLGLIHVPLHVSLVAVVALAVIADGWMVARRGRLTPSDAGDADSCVHPHERSPLIRVWLPLLLAGMVGLISLIPIFRAGYETVPGQNGDAILVVGSATLLEHAPPTATRLDQPINHIPLQWRSKYPIYFALAGISELAGQDPIQAFAAVSALVLALTALGFFLFARYVLRAPPWLALLALFLVPLDRIVVYVAIHPYYNELWGQFALPFMLLAGWRYVTAPSRSAAGLLALFLVLGLLAYPLMVLFPAAFLIALAWATYRHRRRQKRPPGWISALGLPRISRRVWMWAPAVAVAVPVVVVLGRGFLEKISEAAAVLAPGTDLSGWQGSNLPFLPGPRFFGMPEAAWGWILVGALFLLAWRGRRQASGTARWALGAMIVLTGLIAIYFRARPGGQLFFFKDLAFLGPYVLLLGLLGLGALALRPARGWRLAGLGGLLAALVLVPVSAAHEINTTFEQGNLSILGLRAWNRALPRGSSVLIDVPPSGYQLWVTYTFKDHRLSAFHPLTNFFPYPPVSGGKADYVIAEFDLPQPAHTLGPPLFHNAQFTLWRMNPAAPGLDTSSRRLLEEISAVSIGG